MCNYVDDCKQIRTTFKEETDYTRLLKNLRQKIGYKAALIGNGTIAGLGYLEVNVIWPCNLPIGLLISVRTVDPPVGVWNDSAADFNPNQSLQRQFCLYIPFLGIARPQPISTFMCL